MPGRLLLVATPIGNLEDLSPRAARALAEADLVACEDTRHSGRLLAHLGVKKRLVSLHEHNERKRIPELVAALARGETIAVVSDAGTPLLSDPGYPLTRAAIAAGATVEAIPGPSAILAALVASGLPPYPFTFAGFAPPKAGKRRTFYRRLGGLGHTVVVYESPHRLVASLDDALAELGADRPAALARELTKLHEEIVRGTLAELAAWAGERKLLGELVLVIGADTAESAPTSARDEKPS
jgi:16S rRNA (cytidine1402-2'-O)-methyltransferase